MPRLTLRTLLAYIDDTLEPDQARDLGKKVADSEEAKKLIERIKKVTRRRGLTTPVPASGDDHASDPNTVAEYLSDMLSRQEVRDLEERCMGSDVHLAEVAACHQILTLVLTEPVRVPPTANQRMYKLVEAPASDPARKPGKAIPVGRTLPPSPDQPDTDDPDAALLLGMQRYSSNAKSGRWKLVGAVGAIAAMLALAVVMALPQHQPKAPEISAVEMARGPVVPIPDPGKGASGLPVTPMPKPLAPKGDSTPVKKVEPVEPKKLEPITPPKDPKIDPPNLEDFKPLAGQEIVGKLDTPNVIVLSRGLEPTAKWNRLGLEGKNVVRANDTVMALPGYVAEVKLDSGVLVTLWGNTPELVSMKSMVMQSRVRFHPPAGRMDADLTLETGRIYLTATKPAGAKVRVRIDSQIWDITLPDEKTDVLVQSSSGYVPGAAYARDGGDPPRTEARLVVTRGTASLSLPKRFKDYELATWSEYIWDSTAGKPDEPHPAHKEEVYADRVPFQPDEAVARSIQRVFFEASEDFADPTAIRLLLKERLYADPSEEFKPGMTRADIAHLLFPTQWAAYSQAAIANGPDASDLLKELLDLLRSESRAFARQAAVIALSSWVAQAPGNTELLYNTMVEKGWLGEDGTGKKDADVIAHLLRGHSSAAMKSPAKLDELIGLLNHEHIAVREAALGNLLAYYADADTFMNRILVETDVANRERDREGADKMRLKAWEAFLSAWKTQADVMRKKMADEAKKD